MARPTERPVEILMRRRGRRAVAVALVFLALTFGAEIEAHAEQAHSPARTPNVNELLRAAEEALNRSDFLAAIKALNAVVEVQPDSTAAWFNLGYAYAALQQDANAVRAYEKTLALQPSLFEARLNLGLLCVETKRVPESLAHLEKAVALKPDHARAHFHYGRALHLAGNADAAGAQFDEALRLDPGLAVAHYELGQLHLKAKRYAEARARFESAAELDPKLASAKLGWALAAEGLAEMPEAAARFEEYLAASAEDVETRFHLARIYLDLGKNEAALEALETVHRARSDLSGLAAALGDVYALLKKFPESEKFYRQAVAAAPAEPDLRRALAQTLLDQEKFSDAEVEFRECLKLDPRNRDAAKGLATSLYLEKRYPEALPLVEALARLPDTPAGIFFVLATCYDHLKDQPRALEAYERFIQLSGGQSPTEEWQARQRAKLLRRVLRK